MACLRTSASVLVLLLAASGTVGCYDLSTSGPTPADFVRENDSTQVETQAEQEQQHRSCGPNQSECPEIRRALLAALDGNGDEVASDARVKLSIVPEED